MSDWTGTTTGFSGGWRIGWDVDPSWGGEMRFAFGSLPLYDSYRAEQALIAMDNANGLAPDDPQRHRFDHRNAEMFQWDVQHPLLSLAADAPAALPARRHRHVRREFHRPPGQGYNVNCLSLPLGIGMKYLCDENFALRLDLLEDIAISNEHLETQFNFSVTAGLEMRFGGSRKIYWPFDLSR